MANVFADTSGFVELFDESQPSHDIAATLYLNMRDIGTGILTTNYVITELVALLISRVRAPRNRVVALVNGLKRSPTVEIVHIDISTDERAWQLLTQRQDKDWSLVDCASFVVMQSHGIQEAFTTDHHFEQAGFIRLLK